jgi:hypothetical protein
MIMLSTVLQEVLQAAWKPRKSIFLSMVVTWLVCWLYSIMVVRASSALCCVLLPLVNHFIFVVSRFPVLPVLP